MRATFQASYRAGVTLRLDGDGDVLILISGVPHYYVDVDNGKIGYMHVNEDDRLSYRKYDKDGFAL